MNKHFFKTLIIFTGMILIGLLTVFLFSYFNNRENVNLPDSSDIAK